MNPESFVVEFETEKPVLPEAKALSGLERCGENDTTELLKHRFLCRGGGLLLAGPTGAGKSSLILQAAVLWALGRPFAGIEPNGPLKTLIIQAENDEGDLAEMRDGVMLGLSLGEDDRRSAGENVLIATEDSQAGHAFLAVVGELLSQKPVDLLVIDPALAYLGGETSSQKDVGAFLRNGLNPIIHKHNCGAVVVHHTNKPPSGREKPSWQAGDFAYIGSGSAEWANWARAVLALRSLGCFDMFELVAGKRGARLRWKDDDNNLVFTKTVGYHREPGVICWHEMPPKEKSTPATGANARPIPSMDEFLSLFPASCDKSPESALRTANQLKNTFQQRGWSRNSYKGLRDDAEAQGLLSTVTSSHNRKLTGRKPVIEAFLKLRAEKGTILEQAYLPNAGAGE